MLKKIYNFHHFVPRKTGLHEYAFGNFAVPGGIGSWDEIYEVLDAINPRITWKSLL